MHGIGEVAELTGLTKDTLRWYEREGLIPGTPRDAAGRRQYDEAMVRLLHLLVRLRRTGMPVAEVKRFVDLIDEGAASHGRRIALLTSHRERLIEQIAALHDDLGAVDDKIDHYETLIAAGLDCAQQPIEDADTLRKQRSRT